MKKLVSVFLVLSLIFAITLVQTKSESKIQKEASQKFKNQDKIRVLVEPQVQKSKILSSQKDFPGKEKHIIDGKISLEVSEAEFQELQKDSTIKSIELISEKKIFLQDSVAQINASITWPKQISSINLTGVGQTACILDTGANFSHPDLIGKNLTCVIDCNTGVSCVENCSVSDDNGHGTHVAGTVAANGNIKGVAPGASLIAVKVCNSGGTCPDDDIRAGIDWCITNYATYNLSAISLSLGSDTLYTNYCDYTDDPSNLTLGINNAIAKNISVLAAAGNSRSTTSISSPACIKNATAIGSIRKNDATFDYNRNSLVKIVTPGFLINSTRRNSGSCLVGCTCSGDYMVCSGTSMATPHATGIYLIINEFKKLQNNKIMTPSEITGNLTLYGKSINDSSGSGLNFSRIDVYTTLIQLDEIAPYVNLTSPSGSSSTQDLTFICNATDHLEVKNVTLTVWNSTSSIINQTNISSTNSFAQLQSNITLGYGSYVWNCQAFDKKGNSGIAASNFSVIVSRVLTTLESPQDNYYTNQNSTTFNCSAQSQVSLTNLTFFIWNSTNSLVYNTSVNISGTANSNNFNYNLTQENNFSWNCLAFNNETNSSYAPSNKTITLDQTSPSINLISPSNGDSSSTGTTTVTFTYNLTETNPSNCSLIINNAIDQTSSTIYTNQSNTFSKSLSAATYSWSINCTDLANNKQNSSTRTITINAASVQNENLGGGGSGGGGGSSTAATTLTLSSTEIESGVTKSIKENDKIKFTDKNSQNHTLTLVQIIGNTTKITIESDPITLTLEKGETKKINLNNDEFYDLEITLKSINFGKAEITLKTIREGIPIKIISESNQTSTNETVEETPKTDMKNYFEKKDAWIALLAIIIIILMVLLVLRKRSKFKRRT